MSKQSWAETLITAQSDGSTLTAASAASALPAAALYTFPANFFEVGKQILIEAAGRISSVITTPGTARFDFRLGGTVVFDSQAILLDTVAAHTTKPWYLRILLTCRAIGASATLMGSGTWTCEDILGTPASSPKGSIVANIPWNTTPAVGTSFDSTEAQQADLFFTQTVATGSMTLHQYSLIALN
jgi:hypothetical protein